MSRLIWSGVVGDVNDATTPKVGASHLMREGDLSQTFRLEMKGRVAASYGLRG